MYFFQLLLFLLLTCNFIYIASAQVSPENKLTLSEILQSVEEYHPLLQVNILDNNIAQASVLKAKSKFIPKYLNRTSYENYKDINNQDKDYYMTSHELSWQSPFAIEFVAGVRTTSQPLLKSDAITYSHTNSAWDSIKKTDILALNQSETRFGIRMPLLQGLITDDNRTALKINKLQLPKTQLQYNKTKNKLFKQVAYQYYDLFFACKEYNIYNQLLKEQQTVQDFTNKLIEAGSIAPIDAINIQNQIIQTQINLQNAETQYKTYLNILNNNIWQSNTKQIINSNQNICELLTVSHQDNQQVLSNIANVKYTQVLPRHPDYQILKLKIQEQLIYKKLASQKYLPKVDLEVLSVQDLENIDDDISLLASVSMSLPLLPYEAKSLNQDAQYKKQQAQELLKLKEQEIKNQLFTNKLNIQNNLKIIQNIQDNINLLEQLVSAEITKYKAGISNLININIQQQALLNTQLLLNKNQLKYQQSITDQRFTTMQWDL